MGCFGSGIGIKEVRKEGTTADPEVQLNDPEPSGRRLGHQRRFKADGEMPSSTPKPQPKKTLHPLSRSPRESLK